MKEYNYFSCINLLNQNTNSILGRIIQIMKGKKVRPTSREISTEDIDGRT